MTQLVVGAVIVDSLTHPTQVLAARRSRPAGLKGQWEFPGGKVEPGESPEAALAREILEELAAEIAIGDELGSGWPINERLELRLFLVETRDEPRPGEDHDELRWLGRDELDQVDWLPADEAALAAVRERL